jgi:peptidoglycan/LPS O-acetylase OafA/YrhL
MKNLLSTRTELSTRTSSRIVLLDSFRFIAITLVVLYHYYSRWTIPHPDNLYPYNDKYRNVIFDNGFLGVHFFFIISGFVIAFSIESCKTFTEFIKKRFIRLFPALLFAAIFTYLVIPFLDSDNSLSAFRREGLGCFIPSLTFIEPYFFQKIFNVQWRYIDDAYWSLAVEVRFYLFYGILFFISRKNIFKNWILFVFVAIMSWLLIREFKKEPLIQNNDIFNLFSYIFLTRYLIYFTLGILFYNLYKNKSFLENYTNLFFSGAILLLLFSSQYVTELQHNKFFMLSFTGSILMLLFIYKPHYLSFLSNKIFQKIGVISYVIYLLHEYIGVALIKYFIVKFNVQSFQFLVPLIVYGIIIIFSAIVYSYFELPVSKYLKALHLGKKPISHLKLAPKVQDVAETRAS